MLTGSSINIGTLPEGQYRFAMYAYNSQGSHGDLSNICYFTVLNESKTPAAPQIWSSQESYSSTEDITLHWNEVENAYNYGITVRLSPYHDDDTIIYDSMLTGNSINIGTLPEGQYRFAMYAYNSQGSHSDLSNICYFTVQESVSEPAITLSDDSQIVLSMLQRTYFSKFPLQEFDYPIQYVGENAYKYQCH